MWRLGCRIPPLSPPLRPRPLRRPVQTTVRPTGRAVLQKKRHSLDRVSKRSFRVKAPAAVAFAFEPHARLKQRRLASCRAGVYLNSNRIQRAAPVDEFKVEPDAGWSCAACLAAMASMEGDRGWSSDEQIGKPTAAAGAQTILLAG